MYLRVGEKIMTKLLFVRHGESAANGKGFFAGHLNVPLSELGHKQASCTGKFISENYAVDAIYSSDLDRAYDTAKPLAQFTGKGIEKCTDLREIFSGDWQGLCFDELQTRYAEGYGVWLCDIGNAKTPSGETVAQLYERVWNAVKEIASAHEGQTVVIVTHATPIRTVVSRLSGKGLCGMKEVPWVSNASVSEVVFEDGEWKLTRVSMDGHLDEMKTSFPANV